MPVNGRLFVGALRFSVKSDLGTHTHTGSGSGTWSHSAAGYTAYTPDSIDVEPGFSLQVGSSSSTPGWQVGYNGPDAPFGGWYTGGSTFLTSVSVEVRFPDQKLYGTAGGITYVSFSQVDLYVNGVYATTLNPAVTASSGGAGPCYVPIFGMPFNVSGSCSTGVTGLSGSTYDGASTAASVVSGGWEMFDGTDWVALPVTLPSIGAPSAGSCPYGLSPVGPVATSTFGELIHCYSYTRSARQYVGRQTATKIVATLTCGDLHWTQDQDPTGKCSGGGTPQRDAYLNIGESEGYGGNVTLQPDLERTIKRMAPGYGAMWLRLLFPETRAGRSRSCTIGATTSSASDSPVVHAGESALLARVGDSTHAIEDVLSAHAYAPCGASHSKSISYSLNYTYLCGAILCGWQGGYPPECSGGEVSPGVGCAVVYPDVSGSYVSQSESCSYTFPSVVEDNPAIGYLYHAEPLPRYLNTWCNPHWQMLLWFPPAEDEEGNQSQWPLDGGPVNRLYWMETRDQWEYQSALPPGEQTRRRTSNIASCIQESGYTPFLDSFVLGMRWIGVSRWVTQDVAIPSSKALDSGSSAAWTLTNCTGAFGANIVLTPSGSGTVIAEYDLGRWTDSPYMLAHIARVAVDWLSANVDAVTVKLVGIDGGSVVLATAPGTYDRPTAATESYAGSWGIDNGDGYTVDAGTDYAAHGISVATMADPERCFAFQILLGRTAAKLRFEVTPTDSGTVVTLKYPVFYKPSGTPAIVWESGQCAAILWPNGPGVRWGNWLWYVPGTGIHNPPLVAGLGYKSTIIDALAFRREVFEGNAWNGGSPDLTTELTQLYDTFEGQSVGQVDSNSLSFLLPMGADATIRLALVNTMSELPPMALWPTRKRDANWQPTGDYAQEAWDHAVEARNYISPSSAPNLADPSHNPWSSPGTTVAGWAISQHLHALTNDEDPDFWLSQASRDWGNVSPWHGYFAILGQRAGDNNPFVVHEANGMYHRASVSDGDIWYRRADTNTPAAGWVSEVQVTTTGDCSRPRMVIRKYPHTILLVFMRGADMWGTESTDRGRTWADPYTITP